MHVDDLEGERHVDETDGHHDSPNRRTPRRNHTVRINP